MPMSMNIQYGNMNKFRELPNAVATGLGLGLQYRKQFKQEQAQQTPNLPIQDPGEKPVVDINQLTQAEQQDIAKYSDLEKKAKGLDETAMYDVRRSAVNETQSPIVKQAMVMGISAKDLDTYMKDIQNKGIDSPSGQILKGRLGGENSAGWQEVQKKIAEVQATQQKLDQEYSIKLKSAISQIEDARENPQKYAKNGQAAESVLKGLQNEGNYLSTLYQMSKEDAAWVEQYLARQQEKRAGGSGSLKVNFRIDENGKLGVYRNGKLDMTESDPNFTTTGSQPISQQDFAAMIMGGQPINRSEARGVPQSVPKNPKQTLFPKGGKKVLTKEEAIEYLKRAGGDKNKAREAARKDGRTF